MQKRRHSRGFTLVELMVVVVIVGVLSVLAVNGFRKWIYSARNAEADTFLGAIRAAQESYFQSFGQYCGTLAEVRWPAAVPVAEKVSWDPIPAGNSWKDLGVKTPGQVWFQYVLVAGRGEPVANGAPFRPGTMVNKAWYWVRAHGDFNGDGTLSTFEISSEKPDVFRNLENE